MGQGDERGMSIVDENAPWLESLGVVRLLGGLLLADMVGWGALYGLNTVRNRMIAQARFSSSNGLVWHALLQCL